MTIKVGVFFGGRSVEHEISVISALQAINAFDADKYTITPIYITKKGVWYSGEALLDLARYRDTDKLLSQCKEVYMTPIHGDYNVYKRRSTLFCSDIVTTLDVVLPVLHGTNGEDGTFQGLMDLIGIPYVGCNPVSSANGMDKIYMKMILRESNIPVIDYVWFTNRDWFSNRESLITRIEAEIGYPIIVKPSNLGSSVGISTGSDRDGLIKAVELAEKFSDRILVEKMVVELKEINCSVLGDYAENQSSVCEEPVRSGAILSYEDKYMSGGGGSSKGMQSTKRRIPAELPQEITDRVQFLASETFRVLSSNGVSRVDFIIDGVDNMVYVNEINTIPGSLSFYLWEASGLAFDKLMDRLIQLAFKRDRELKMKTFSYDQNIFNLKGGSKGGKVGAKR